MSVSVSAASSTSPDASRPWVDAALDARQRVELLLAVMTLEEKVAQLSGLWKDFTAVGIGEAPSQDGVSDADSYELARRNGVGHLTKPVGTLPQRMAEAARRLAELQQDLLDNTRLGVPAIAHEECLSGFTTYGATIYPTPLAWAATFEPALVQEMAVAIGRDMRACGIHQGLAPVLDVVRDHRWGRVEETMGEDPYLVGCVGAAYVAGLQTSGTIATLKHFAGYSTGLAGRNHAPAQVGVRELRDIMLVPFEMAVRAGAGSVMNSYCEIDGVPAAVHRELLTGILRDEWAFEGTVVSDYWAIPFLEAMHGVADSPTAAGILALRAGIDVELPDTRCFGDRLVAAVREGLVAEADVDLSVRRVLRQKFALGLLDQDWSARPQTDFTSFDLDSPANRSLARQLAEHSVVLLDNREGILPLDPCLTRIAVVGPCADDVNTLFGCYSFPNHVREGHPGWGNGVEAASVLDALRTEFPDGVVNFARGCSVTDRESSGIPEAVAAASNADVCIAVVGDRSGLFGRGTSGEGCDVADLRLPGVQADLVEAIIATGTPTVLVLVAGRPHALGSCRDGAAAIVQAFFPGEEGGPAIAGVIGGRINPSGKLPVQIPGQAGVNPATYLHPLLAEASQMSSSDPTPVYPFGHGLSYTAFDYGPVEIAAESVDTAGTIELTCEVGNVGARDGAEVVQLYARDPFAQVTRPVKQLIGFARVEMAAGDHARVRFRIHTDRLSFVGLDGRRIVEPGEIILMVGASSTDIRHTCRVVLTGPTRVVSAERALYTDVSISSFGR